MLVLGIVASSAPLVAARSQPASTGTARIISSDYGKEAWKLNRMGSPAQLTHAHVETLRQASAGTPIVNERVEVGADGAFTRSFAMRENDVWFVELRPVRL